MVDEIRFLKKHGAELMGLIQIHEDYLNQKQSQNLKIDRYDLNELQEMIEKFLRILALIDVYQYFESKNQTLTDDNIDCFFAMVNNDYSLRMDKFMKDLISEQSRN